MLAKKVRAISSPAKFIHAKAELDAVVQFEWVGDQPGPEAWGDINFILAETLGAQYEAKNIVRLAFRGIPETEQEYSVTADVLAKNPVQLNPVRDTLKKRKPSSSLSSNQVPFVIDIDSLKDEYPGLDDRDKKMLNSFNQLPLQRRIHFWQEFIASYFK
jgi:hypothetical protein